jgi:hypothetical protein
MTPRQAFRQHMEKRLQRSDIVFAFDESAKCCPRPESLVTSELSSVT